MSVTRDASATGSAVRPDIVSGQVPDNLFELLTRHPVRMSFDPAEHRLTTALSALLRQDDGFTGVVLGELIGDDTARGDVRVDVEKRVRLDDGRFGRIDMEVDVRGRARRLLVWVEAKYKAPYSDRDQLAKYVAALGREQADARVLLVLAPAYRHRDLLAPDGSRLPFASERDATSDGVGPWFVSWERVYRALEGAAALPTTPAHVCWLARELLAFLGKKGLKPVPLKPEHVEALDIIGEAETAIGAIVEAATAMIDEAWPARTTEGDARVAGGYLELLYQPTSPGGRSGGGPWQTDTRFGWGIDGGKAFAGIAFSAESGPLTGRQRNEAWPPSSLTIGSRASRVGYGGNSTSTSWRGSRMTCRPRSSRSSSRRRSMS
jgi:hypothetical protein